MPLPPLRRYLPATAVAVAAALLALAAATSTTGAGSGQVRGRVVAPVDALQHMHMSLRGSGAANVHASTQPTPSGAFLFDRVPLGSYVLTVISPTLVFQRVRVDVSASSSGALRYSYRELVSGERIGGSLILQAARKADFFEPQPTFNPLPSLRSPMLLILAFTALMIFVLPKLGGWVDEQQQQTQQQQQRVTGRRKTNSGGGGGSGGRARIANSGQ